MRKIQSFALYCHMKNRRSTRAHAANHPELPVFKFISGSHSGEIS